MAPTIGSGDRRRVRRREACLQRAVRRQRQLELTQDVVGNAVQVHTCERDRRRPLHVPGVVAAEDGGDVLLGHRHPAVGRIAALPARVVFTRPLRVVVDDARVVGDLEVRPVCGEAVGLADLRRFQPAPEIWMVLRFSPPIALSEACRTARASCADAVAADKSRRTPRAATAFSPYLPP